MPQSGHRPQHHEPTFQQCRSISAIPPKADVLQRDCNAPCFVPKRCNGLSESSNIAKILPNILFFTALSILIGNAYVSEELGKRQLQNSCACTPLGADLVVDQIAIKQLW
jgi:hypothetical protein